MGSGELLDVDLPPRGEEAVLTAEVGVGFEIVFFDEDVIVVDKPAGLVVHPGSGHHGATLVGGLLHRFPDLASVPGSDPDRPGIVHRLDKGTSGLLVVARSSDAYRSLADQIRTRAVGRSYLALAHGALGSDEGVIDAPIGRSERDRTAMALSSAGRQARTRYRVVERYAEPISCCLLECQLDTGRTHQIRVHLASIGHPIVGDRRYGGRSGPSLGLDRPFLHAHRLVLTHPRTGEQLVFVSSLPAELTAVLSELT